MSRTILDYVAASLSLPLSHYLHSFGRGPCLDDQAGVKTVAASSVDRRGEPRSRGKGKSSTRESDHPLAGWCVRACADSLVGVWNPTNSFSSLSRTLNQVARPPQRAHADFSFFFLISSFLNGRRGVPPVFLLLVV